MKKSTLILKALLIVFGAISISSLAVSAQDSTKLTYKVTADVVSHYNWRGVDCPGYVKGPGLVTPNFQPTLAIVYGNLEVGTWGSSSFDGNYKEIDLYATYTLGPVAITAYDYNWGLGTVSYFNYKAKETQHIFELSALWKGPESFPLSVTVASFLYGNDHPFDKTLGTVDVTKQNYSTYIELGYPVKSLNFVLGMTPSNGYYGAGYGKVDGFAVVNVGVNSTKTLKISDKWELPIKTTLGFNPQAETSYLVFGITF